MNQAMDLAVIFSERNECTRENLVKIVVGEGEHVMVGVAVGYQGSMAHVCCSNITIVGKGKCKTTVLGGFYVNGKQNVKIEQLSVTNEGDGLICEGSGTNVDVTECCFKTLVFSGMFLQDGATATAARCEFLEHVRGCGVFCRDANTKVRLIDCKMHHNGNHGLGAQDNAVVDLHGTTTDIHSNNHSGIWAYNRGKVNIHLPSQHNTSHDNVEEDRVQQNGGSIANINADGTFTHVVVEEEDDE
jgi:uncharacterized Zn-binding protein involved in type VI secretion